MAALRRRPIADANTRIRMRMRNADADAVTDARAKMKSYEKNGGKMLYLKTIFFLFFFFFVYFLSSFWKSICFCFYFEVAHKNRSRTHAGDTKIKRGGAKKTGGVRTWGACGELRVKSGEWRHFRWQTERINNNNNYNNTSNKKATKRRIL